MFLKFNEHNDTIFLDTNSENFQTKKRVNVILSPSLYWVKKVSLPVKSIRKIRTLLPSLFEDTLPPGRYSYQVYKSGDDFLIFAYQDKVILNTLKNKGISQAQVKNVYFAQNELAHIEKAMKINDTQSIYLQDELLVLVPTSWLKDSTELDMSSIHLSSNHIRLRHFGHIISDRSIYMLYGMFSLLILILAIEYFITMHKISETTEMRENLFAKNSLMPTMIQNRSLLQEYKGVYSIQTKFREYVSYILSLKLTKDQRLELLSLKNKKLYVEFSGVSKGDALNIEKIFKSKGMEFISNFKNNSWRLEIKL
ncbi:MAG: hypothetical protein R3331_03535 [Sulfurospirillaceae bacterium]|nr:hypothetical protein [Sulfurospirillaceae bacterium]